MHADQTLARFAQVLAPSAQVSAHAAKIRDKIEAFNAATPFRPYLVWVHGKRAVEVKSPEDITLMNMANSFIVNFPKESTPAPPGSLCERHMLMLLPSDISLVQYELTNSEMVKGVWMILGALIKNPFKIFELFKK